MRAKRREPPQVDASIEFNDSPAYASRLIGDLKKRFTMKEIAVHTGISERLLYYMPDKGINDFSKQLVLEVLANRRKLEGEPAYLKRALAR